MRGLEDDFGIRNPADSLIFHAAGQYDPRPTLTPMSNVVNPLSHEYVVTGLDPYTQYEFKITSQNSISGVESIWAVGATKEAGN